MKHNPQIRSMVLRGYVNLAFYIGIVLVFVLPIIFHPGVRGIKIALIACGAIGIGLAIGERIVRHQWSRLFVIGLIAWCMAQLGIAYFLPPSNVFAQTMIQLLILFALALPLFGIPWILKRQGTHPK